MESLSSLLVEALRLGSVFGQRDEFCFARHPTEAICFPISLGLLDALLAGGHEIPPDVAGTIDARAAQEHHASLRDGGNRNCVARFEDQQLRCFEQIVRDSNRTFSKIN